MTTSLLPDELVALARKVVEQNAAAGRKVALAESCTGGLVAAAITVEREPRASVARRLLDPGRISRDEPAWAAQVAARALERGLRYVDTAPYYGFGLSERRVGDTVRGRKDVVVSTKVGRLLAPDPSEDVHHGWVTAASGCPGRAATVTTATSAVSMPRMRSLMWLAPSA